MIEKCCFWVKSSGGCRFDSNYRYLLLLNTCTHVLEQNPTPPLPGGLNKRFSSRSYVGSWIWHETPEEGRRTHLPKCKYNNEDETNSVNILSDKNGVWIEKNMILKFFEELFSFLAIFFFIFLVFYNLPCYL